MPPVREVEFPSLEEHAPRLGRRDTVLRSRLQAEARGILEPQVIHASETLCQLSSLLCSAGASYMEGSGSETHMEGSGKSNPSENPNTLPTRRPERRPVSDLPMQDIDRWFSSSCVKIGDAITEEQKNSLKRLLFTYQDLNSTELEDLPPTDLYVHRVRLKEGTQPFSRVRQRRWPPGKEFWLRKIINEGLKCGMYERTIEANGKLSDWNAQAQIVDKSDNPGEWDEPRITFNYQNVIEEMPGTYLELMSRVHDHLGHPTHKFFHKLDLKHGYWAIRVHPEDRHLFAFTIPGIGQLQPARMPQGSMTAGFSFTELMNIVFGVISPLGEFEGMESLMSSETPESLPKLSFYIDDIFAGFRTFEEGYDLLANEVFPRLVWAKLKLSFKKLELFVEETCALGVLHKVGGKLYTKPDRCDKIRAWEVPRSTSEVRRFLGAIGLCKRWVKNFSEIKRPLTQLTGDIEFHWGNREQVCFQLLKEKCSEVVEMFGWDFLQPTQLYSDASQFGAGCVITQHRENALGNGKSAEVPIIYDAFTFSKPQKNYGVYKKELCAIVEFARKYEHMLRSSRTSTIFTDHKPLTYFLQSSTQDGIYARWACELRSLNVVITWIPGSRNAIADALSRTIFPDEGGSTDIPELQEFGEMVTEDGNPRWIWKDGKDGYQELLKRIGGPLHERDLRSLILGEPGEMTSPGLSAFASELRQRRERIPKHVADALLLSLSQLESQVYTSSLNTRLNSYLGEQAPKLHIPDKRYLADNWYSDIAQYLTSGEFPELCITKVQRTAFLRRASRYSTNPGGDLYINIRGIEKRCITRSEVAPLLMEAHDHGGHFASQLTSRRMHPYHWPCMAKDIRDYILGCLICATHGPAVRSQTAARVTVSEPMELLGVDFIGPFPKFEGAGEYWILIVVDYFTRYIWAKATWGSDSTTVTIFLEDIFSSHGYPVGMYMDPGPHFGRQTKEWAESRGIVWCNSPVAAKRSVGMIEKSVHILQNVLEKYSVIPSEWPLHLRQSVFEVNKRNITHLLHSPSEILYGYDPAGSLETKFPSENRQSLRVVLETGDPFLDKDEHCDRVIQFMSSRSSLRSEVLFRSDQVKDRRKEKHDLGVHQKREYSPGELVMLYDHQTAGKKLRPSWRGPFVVTGYGGDMGKSYCLRQISGDPIPRHYHGDSLKPFRLREGYLVTHKELALLLTQNIRLGRSAFKLPKDLRTVPGARRT